MRYVLIVIIVIIAILAILYIAIKASGAAAKRVERAEQVAKDNTAFMRDMTARAELLMKSAKNDEAKQVAKEVYEAFRYSDPKSADECIEINQMIRTEFDNFSKQMGQITADSDEKILGEHDTLIRLLDQRNALLKSIK